MADFLTNLYQAAAGLLTGNQPQQPISSSQAQPSGQTPQQPGQAPQQPQQPGGLASFLNNPAVQGGLATYFSLLAQPRVGGWGRGLGNAGLSGLQAYEGAEQRQLEMPLKQAELQKAQAEGGMAQSEQQYYAQGGQGGSSAMQRHLDPGASAIIANKKTADETAAQAMTVPDPQLRQKMLDVAEQIRNSPTFVTPDDRNKLIYTDYAQEGKVKQSEIEKNEATTKMLQGGGKPTIMSVGGTVEAVTPLGAKPIPGIGAGTTVSRVGGPERPNYKSYTDAAGRIHTIDVNTETPDPSWAPYGKPAADKGPEYKTYSDLAGKTHTLDVRKERPDPSWVPWSKPAKPPAPHFTGMTDAQLEAEATRRTTAELGHAPAAGLVTSLTGAAKTFSDRFNARREQIKAELMGEERGGKGAAAGPTPAEMAEHPGAVWHPEMGAHGEVVLPDGTHVPFVP